MIWKGRMPKLNDATFVPLWIVRTHCGDGEVYWMALCRDIPLRTGAVIQRLWRPEGRSSVCGGFAVTNPPIGWSDRQFAEPSWLVGVF